MKTWYLHVESLMLHRGIDVVVSENTTLEELREISAMFMEKETHGQFLAQKQSYLIRCLDHCFVFGNQRIQDSNIANGECFYLL